MVVVSAGALSFACAVSQAATLQQTSIIRYPTETSSRSHREDYLVTSFLIQSSTIRSDSQTVATCRYSTLTSAAYLSINRRFTDLYWTAPVSCHGKPFSCKYCIYQSRAAPLPTPSNCITFRPADESFLNPCCQHILHPNKQEKKSRPGYLSCRTCMRTPSHQSALTCCDCNGCC